jgi:hypothetical protein
VDLGRCALDMGKPLETIYGLDDPLLGKHELAWATSIERQ